MALSKMSRTLCLNMQKHRTPLFLGACAAFYLTADHLFLQKVLSTSASVGLLHDRRQPMVHLNHAMRN